MIKCGLFHTFHTEFKDFHDLEKSFCFCLFLNTFFFCFPDCAGETLRSLCIMRDGVLMFLLLEDILIQPSS